ncbi:MAG: hypothetical protein KAR73_14195 [Spirochaetales bacterium]|nr:hypothetical protein [Spirochaetales bacterium]
MEREIEIRVGDKRIAINQFTKEIIESTLVGMLKSLKHVEVDEKIQITLGAVKK